MIIGSTGFLGQNILYLGNENYEMIGTYFKNKIDSHRIYLNSEHHMLVKKVITSYKPRIVIDASKPTYINTKTTESTKRNLSYMKNLISTCNVIGAKLCFISSDSVFDGDKGNYKEMDVPHPLTKYGKLKFDSEKLISHFSNDFLIVRTSLLFGWNMKEKNFVMWVIENLQKNTKIKVIKDQYVSPSYCPHVAMMILESIQNDVDGIIHLAGSSRLTRLELSKLICKVFTLNKDLLIPVSIKDTNFDIKRGKYTTLNVDKAKRILKNKPFSALTMLNEMKKDEKNFK